MINKILLSFLFFIPSISFAAITEDAVSNSGVVAAASTYNWNHTVGSLSNGVLIVAIAARDASAAPGDVQVTGVTYNSVAMTKAREDIIDATSTRGCVSIWYLVNPASGTNSIAVTHSGTVDHAGAGAISYAGVSSSPINTSGTDSSAAAATASVSLTTSVDGVVGVSAVYGAYGSGVTAGATFTEKWDLAVFGGGDAAGGGASSPLSVGTTSMQWTQPGPNSFIISSAVGLTPYTTSTRRVMTIQ